MYTARYEAVQTAVNFCFQTLGSVLDKSEELHVVELLSMLAAVLLACVSLPFLAQADAFRKLSTFFFSELVT